MRVFFPLPNTDFDPTEAAVPFQILKQRGHEVVFATPDGARASADPRVLSGKGFGLLTPFLRATPYSRELYGTMTRDESFRAPLTYEAMRQSYSPDEGDGLMLVGGHAPGMKPYLESSAVHETIRTAMDNRLAVGAICHGVLAVARARDPETGRSVLHGRKTTSLLSWQELVAWAGTALWLGRYYRTYPETVQAEVKSALKSPDDFVSGPPLLFREGPNRPDMGFVVEDDNYVSARFFGDAYRFGHRFCEALEQTQPASHRRPQQGRNNAETHQ